MDEKTSPRSRAPGRSGGPDLDRILATAVRQHQAGRLREAEKGYRRILEVRPDQPDALRLLGLVAYQAGRNEIAVELLRRAVRSAPDFAEAHHNLAIVLQAQGRIDEAVEAYRRTLALVPAHGETFGHLARLYEERNRLDLAAEWVEKGLRVAGDNPLLNMVAARLARRDGRLDEALDRLTAVNRPSVPAPIREKIEYELGRLHDRAGHPAQAFTHFTEANLLSSRKWIARNIDRKKFSNDIDVLRETFNPSWVESWSPAPPLARGETPLFLIGFPRSGTTLLEQVLDGHPRLRTLEETPAVESMVRIVSDLPGGYPDALARLRPDQFARLREAYFETLGRDAGGDGGALLVDKLPLNIVQAGPIHRVFPAARFILALRHPCDVCLSCFMQDFQITAAMVNFFTVEDAANLYAKVMDLWRDYVAVLPLDYCAVRYEDLVSDFEPEVRRIVDWIGLDWHDGVLDHAGGATRRERIRTPSYHQVAEPIYRRSRYRWRRYAEQLAPVAGVLAPFIDRFGYAGPGSDGG